MLIKDFVQLSPEYQLEYVNRSGYWLIGVINDIFCYHLYWLDTGYFVEISVNVARQSIHNIVAFTHTKNVDKYLERIEINELKST
ncbi:hypothetical protein WJR50_22670 [Catalinimonas sp. 4WD22]|uniref:hypothetical protein n=1 Tax=Catalinimonas locisalis TaxID=3133978 RepID=UPI003101A1B7